MSAPDVTAYTRERRREGRVPLSTKIAQGVGALPEVFKGFGFNTLLLFYYNQVLGVPVVLASIAIAITTVVDGAVDPLIGSWSDNLRTRLGRRHPLMYAAAVPLGIGLFLVFTPPAGLGDNGLFAWLLATTICVHVAISVYGVPWTALNVELSEDYAERTSLVTTCYAVGWVGGLTFVYCAWTFIFPSSAAYDRGQLNPDSYRAFAPVVAVCATAAALLSTHLTRRELPYLAQPVGRAPAFDVLHVLREIASTLKNRDFLVLFAGALMSACIAGTSTALELYVQTWFWGLRPEDLRWFSVAILGAVLAFAVVGPLQRVFDKKAVMLGCFALLLIDGVGIVALRLTEVLPANGDPRLIVILASNQVLRTALETALGIMFISMLADSLDAQELRTGKRQEGMFAAALSFSTKATAGLGALLGGLLLAHVIRWPETAPRVAGPDLVFRLGLVFGVVIPAFYLVPLLMGRWYRISRESHAGIRQRIEAQRSSATPPGDPPEAVEAKDQRLSGPPRLTPLG